VGAFVNILLQPPRDAAGAWQAALARALPEATIAVWPEAPEATDYALVWKPPEELFLRVRPKRAIFNLGAGVDRLLAVHNLPAKVPVIRLEDAGMAGQMAEYATLAVLRAYRQADEYAAQQREGVWRPRELVPKSEYTVGILGHGVLGRAVALGLGMFGFRSAAWNRTRSTDVLVEPFAGRAELPAFLAKSRVLVCLLPLTPETESLLDRRALEALPRGAHLVNVARGEIVVDADLIALLDSGHLASATLDVFRDEPLPPSHPFWHHPRITLTPHVSAVTSVDGSVTQIAFKIRRLQRGLPVTGVVDRARGY
jgi:glyoxylate/hydroxypyruvate reductase A